MFFLYKVKAGLGTSSHVLAQNTIIFPIQLTRSIAPHLQCTVQYHASASSRASLQNSIFS